MRPHLFLAILSIAATPAVASDAAYDLRGAKLGMSIDEFRQLSIPSSFEVRPRTFCTGDKLPPKQSFPIIGGSMRDAGWIKCGLFTYERHMNRWAEKLISVSTTAAAPDFYFFQGATSSTHRLFWITTGVPSRAISDIIAGLTERFGAPIDIDVVKVQNRMGAVFSSTEARWSNATGEIIVKERDGRIDQGSISYRHHHLSTEAMEAIKKAQGSRSKNL